MPAPVAGIEAGQSTSTEARGNRRVALLGKSQGLLQKKKGGVLGRKIKGSPFEDMSESK